MLLYSPKYIGVAVLCMPGYGFMDLIQHGLSCCHLYVQRADLGDSIMIMLLGG
jgi:hypothetical protein